MIFNFQMTLSVNSVPSVVKTHKARVFHSRKFVSIRG